ncbi:DNA polymerase III subunit gamma/tau [Chloroflexota bacterium]
MRYNEGKMTSQVFYRKWRPQILAEIFGQEQVTQTLLNALSNDRLSHAYLFCGPRGTGKTSTGRILAKAVNCLTNGKGEPCNTCDMCQAITGGRALDVIEIDAASNTGVEDIRSLREKVNYAPSQAKYKVYIIDEVHMLSTNAANALLKTLEEPPEHVIFILATTEAHKIIPTILSRCQRFDFRRISSKDAINKLVRICDSEEIKAEVSALQLIAKASTGSLRDAENILQQLVTYYGKDIGLEQVQAVLGITGDWRTRELVKHIVNKDVSAGVATINSVNDDGLDLQQFHRELLEYLRELLLVKTGSDQAVDFTTEDMADLKSLAANIPLVRILSVVKLFGQLDFGFDSYSPLPLELALIECILDTETNGVPGKIEKEADRIPAIADSTKPQQKVTEAKLAEPAVPSDTKAKTRVTPPVVAEKPDVASGESETATAKPEAVAASAASPESGSELEQLQLTWRQVVAQAPEDVRRTPAVAILRSAGVKPMAFDDDTVVLAFKYPLHKEKMEEPENQKVVEQIISSFLGRSCRVRCIYEVASNHLVQEAQRMGAQIISVEEK